MNQAQRKEVVATLLKAGRRDLAERFVGATYTLDDDAYQKWPEPTDWDVYPSDRASKFGDNRVMNYQYIGGGGIRTIVTFNGEGLVLDRKGTPTWSYEAFGKSYSGTWQKTAEIPKILADILRKTQADKAKYMQMLERKLQVSGWELNVLDGSELEYSKEHPQHTDWFIFVTFDDADSPPEVLKKHAGDWSAVITDTGTYENVQENQEDGQWKTFGDIPKILKKYEASVDKWFQRG